MLDLKLVTGTVLDDSVKGIPGGTPPFALADIAQKSWNVLRDDLPFPLLVMKQTALRHNLELMKGYLDERGLFLSPHGKTYMAPQLFDLQLAAGAWAITAATVNQAQVYRRFGINRIFLANQLVGAQHVRYIVQELNANPGFDFYCLVDSVDGVQHLASLARKFKAQRPIKVLLEAGFPGGRAGCRTREEVRAVLQSLRGVQDVLALAGIEGFEGTIISGEPEDLTARVNAYLAFVTSLLVEIGPADMPGATEIVLSAGGSAHFDLVGDAFKQVKSFLPTRVVLRSGCYLTHDSEMFEVFQDGRNQRGWKGRLQPALEVWAYLQSLPEPGLAILGMGKRDCPYDYKLPLPLKLYRGTSERKLQGCSITALNDQHAYMKYEGPVDLKIGDRIVCGISHPCTAFDKWRFVPVVNDQYDVIDGILTFF